VGILAAALPGGTEHERSTTRDTAQGDLRDLDRSTGVGELVTVRRDPYD
jgi:hypothetical protein